MYMTNWEERAANVCVSKVNEAATIQTIISHVNNSTLRIDICGPFQAKTRKKENITLRRPYLPTDMYETNRLVRQIGRRTFVFIRLQGYIEADALQWSAFIGVNRKQYCQWKEIWILCGMSWLCHHRTVSKVTSSGSIWKELL